LAEAPPEERVVQEIRKLIEDMNKSASAITESAKKAIEDIRRVTLALEKLSAELKTSKPKGK